MTEHVVVDRLDGVVRVRLQREDKKNALTGAMYARMADVVAEVDRDPSARVLLLTGGPNVFTAGNDLNDFLDPNRDPTGVARFLEALPVCKKPVVAAVNGYAVGIGTTMLLHCDLVYVGRGAKLRMPFVDLGLVPEFASSLLLPRLVGLQRAASLFLLGETMSGQAAFDYGLATEVLDDALVQEHALERATLLAMKAPSAVQQTKSLMRAATADLIGPVIQREGEIFAKALFSEEAREAMTATMEKRAPDFSKFG